MSFRDDRDAMRTRIEELEAELERTRRRLEVSEREAIGLRSRLAMIEEAPRPRVRVPEAAQRALPALGVLVGLVVVVGLVFTALDCVTMTSLGRASPPSIATVDLDGPPPPPFRAVASGFLWAPGDCAGYYAEAPQFVLRNARSVGVHFALSGERMNALLVLRTEGGEVRCEPALRVVLPPGEHRVWVGTATGQPESFTLQIEPQGRS
jgi:hypothetical protein